MPVPNSVDISEIGILRGVLRRDLVNLFSQIKQGQQE